MTLSGCAAVLVGSLALVGCAKSKPPVHWETGGERLDLARAEWTYKGDKVVVVPRGDYAEVLVDGTIKLVIDRVGRVYTRLQQPVALLEPDGRLVGANQELLGTIGASFAALPGKANAWLAISERGSVVKYDADGTTKGAGVWQGCSFSPYAQQACLLISYMLYFDDEGVRAPDLPPVPVGPAVGVGVGVGAP